MQSQIQDILLRLSDDPPGGQLADKASKALRSELKRLPSDIEKKGARKAAGCPAEVWYRLVCDGSGRILSTLLCSFV